MNFFCRFVLFLTLFFYAASPLAHATMMIAVGGGSRSGKTTIAKRLTSAIEDRKLGTVVNLAQDNYFNPKEQPKEHYRTYSYKDIDGENPNYDHPTAMDWKLIQEHLTAIRDGKTVRPPKYLFGTGGERILDHGDPIEAPDYLVFEGIHALNDEIAPHFHLKVFIEISEDVQKVRLVAAGKEREQSQKDTDSYFPILTEAFLSFIQPTLKNADLTLRGDKNLDENVGLILKRINQDLNGVYGAEGYRKDE